MREELEITVNGRQIRILWYNSSDTPQGVILITAALGVKQLYYGNLAKFLAHNGYMTYTMDYSGIGLSGSEQIKSVTSDIFDWIDEIDGVIDYLKEQYNDLPLYYVSHSLGGQLFGSLRNMNQVDKAVLVNCQNGYWRYYSSFLMPIFWYLLVPLYSRFYGYFPSAKFDMGESVPKNVMLRWKKWCTSKDYLFDDPEMKPSHDQYQGKIMAWSFTDDPYAPLEALVSLLDHYSQANMEHYHVGPEEYQLEQIGHFGFFKEKCKPMWEKLVVWLR